MPTKTHAKNIGGEGGKRAEIALSKGARGTKLPRRGQSRVRRMEGCQDGTMYEGLKIG